MRKRGGCDRYGEVDAAWQQSGMAHVPGRRCSLVPRGNSKTSGNSKTRMHELWTHSLTRVCTFHWLKGSFQSRWQAAHAYRCCWSARTWYTCASPAVSVSGRWSGHAACDARGRESGEQGFKNAGARSCEAWQLPRAVAQRPHQQANVRKAIQCSDNFLAETGGPDHALASLTRHADFPRTEATLVALLTLVYSMPSANQGQPNNEPTNPSPSRTWYGMLNWCSCGVVASTMDPRRMTRAPLSPRLAMDSSVLGAEAEEAEEEEDAEGGVGGAVRAAMQAVHEPRMRTVACASASSSRGSAGGARGGWYGEGGGKRRCAGRRTATAHRHSVVVSRVSEMVPKGVNRHVHGSLHVQIALWCMNTCNAHDSGLAHPEPCCMQLTCKAVC